MITNNNTDNGTDTFSTAIVIESICSCSLSILGSVAIFGTYIFIPDIRNSARKLVTCLTVADFVTALGYFTSAFAHLAGTQREVCIPQSVITTYSSLVSFYLTVAIAIHIFATIVYKNDKTSSWKFLLCANVTSWCIPAIIILAAGVNDVLGRDTTESVGTGPWCWIKRDHTNYAFWMFFTGKGWELLCYLMTTALYVLLKFYLFLKYKRRRFADIHESLRDNDQNYLYVWFVLYVLRLWGSIRSIMSLTGVDKHSPGDSISKGFMHMQALGDPGQAFCNCILFCFLDKTVRSNLPVVCFGAKENKSIILPEEKDPLVVPIRHDGCEGVPSDEDDEHGHNYGRSGLYSSYGSIKQGDSAQSYYNVRTVPV
ncbi:G-protein coupled receptor 157-like [Mercenaria mercenaria]|uniref:G-protein coupled receptor 157-like n=1 Tax=Mercenaria mercenaria TaxID=6596 RepID=UPI00234EBBE6|nr:G-protein coupled receptor 157-like [Mercenaria mercenaria]